MTHAKEALTGLAAGERFDVILSDFMMPEMSGMEVHQRLLLQIDPEQAKRVVFLTGGAFTLAGRQYLDALSNPIVEEPFSRADLLSVIGEIAGAKSEEP